MTSILVIKTGALGDVLRTTSILPGLSARYPNLSIDWVTAPAAVELVERHPLVDRVHALDPRDDEAVTLFMQRIAGQRFDRVLSFDDEEPLCRLAASFEPGTVSGATLVDGARTYTDDVAEWFEMGLLSVHGKERADELKKLNTRSHPEIYASMLGIEMGRPELPLDPAAEERAQAFAQTHGLGSGGPIIGLNTGAGGRWTSKTLPEERVIRLAEAVDASVRGKTPERRPHFLLFGGPDERDRNERLAQGLSSVVQLVDAGVDNSLADFAALVDLCDLLVTSDSLALHVAVARHVRIVAFFAPTSAAEIELYGAGRKVVSTAPDVCSYKKDADRSTLTVERLSEAVVGELAELDLPASDLRSGASPA